MTAKERYKISENLRGQLEGYDKGKAEARKELIEEFERMIDGHLLILKSELKDFEESRPKRMKTANRMSWGMQRTEIKIDGFEEFKENFKQQLSQLGDK